MASGIFAVLDDIAALMDDVAVASKVATQKTAGILGDDLAVNAEKATGFVSSRELPVLWKITKGSLLNKIIIIPLVLLLNFFFPIAIKVALIIGGFYLAYEGMEKIIEFLFHRKHDSHGDDNLSDVDDVTAENKKVKSAITTDFILSVEIIIIALGTVLDKSFWTQVISVSIVALIATFGVYGIVALIVRMDDAGYNLIKRYKNKGFMSSVGEILVKGLPWVIKTLSVVGTIALILVSGGIFDHNIDALHHFLPEWSPLLKQIIYGIVAGTGVFLILSLFKKMKPAK